VETPFAQEFLVSLFRHLSPDECRHVLDPDVVETEMLGCNILFVVEFLPVFIHIIILDEAVHVPGFFCLANLVREDVEDVLLQNVNVDLNVRIESFEFAASFGLKGKSNPIQLTLFSCSIYFIFRRGLSRKSTALLKHISSSLCTLIHALRLAIRPGISMCPLPRIGLHLLMLRVRYETACRVLEIFQVPEKRLLDVFDEPGIQIGSRQDECILGFQ